MNIILGLTGSVATTVAPKVIDALSECTIGVNKSKSDILCVMTEHAKRFCNPYDLDNPGCRVFDDSYEWAEADRYVDDKGVGDEYATYERPPPSHLWHPWKKNDPVRHIEMSRNAAALVIAPASMNTIAKMAHGICDNLLTSIYFAMPPGRPVIIAPAMNSVMFASKANQENLITLLRRGVLVIGPVEKNLACGDFGMGAMSNAKDISDLLGTSLRWQFPLQWECQLSGEFPGIPVGSHLGAFGVARKHDKRHCGVDLYARKGTYVYPVEWGKVVAVDRFTGASVGSPWWNETMSVKVEGPSGVVCYGEIDPFPSIRIGGLIETGNPIGTVSQVLKDGQLRLDIPGHSLSMLHLQLYVHGMIHKDESWLSGAECPVGVIDPTPFLLCSAGNGDIQTLDMPKEPVN